ncbi:potassium channel family protein [Kallotenue papyrolyticum]|uniref:potassium channel family protein n=1 Tax=Kallotenue papyrolyticum TaxID=1325125 RepID=UPI00047863A2|nr:TrkA family potassium uptake protein [Kallotenue papyrolyticum]
MQAIIVGCGRVGVLLAHLLEDDGHHVTVVDKNPTAFRNLGAGFRGRTVAGVGFDRDVLREAGIERADALAAVTSGDNSNFITATVARDTFHVPIVVARIYDPQREQIYRRLGIRTISSTVWGAQTIKRMILHSDLGESQPLGNGEVHLVRAQVNELLVGHTVRELNYTGEITVYAIERLGRAFVPRASTTLEMGDVLHLSVAATALPRIEGLIQR